jgi:hypothetical protein
MSQYKYVHVQSATYHDHMIVLLGEGGQAVQYGGGALLGPAGHPGHEALHTVGHGAWLHLRIGWSRICSN